MSRWAGLALILVAAGALAVRLPHLDRRPMHTDESVHAIKFLGLWRDGVYRYDPNEYHGPLLYYATLPAAWVSGARQATDVTETTLRLVPLGFGVGLILLLPLLRDGLGWVAVLGAALLTALSPAMVFYSRYYIHEVPLIFWTLFMLGAGWRYARSRHWGWALASGAGAGLMFSTKETCVFAFAAMGFAFAVAVGWGRRRGESQAALRGLLIPAHLILAGLGAGAVALVLFSSFFTNASGPLDSLRTYLPWLHRAGGASPHTQPWYFYFERLGWFHHGKGPVWTEALVFALALVGGISAFTRRGVAGANPALTRFLACYTLALTLVYSLIAYKTPWCLLGFWQGMVLLGGLGVAALWQWAGSAALRVGLAAVLLAAMAQLGWQAWRTAHTFAADRQNPYVYAHTSADLLRLVGKVRALAALHPKANQALIQVIAPGQDYWPLPWYLRQFTQVGWWGAIPENPYAPLMLVGSKFDAEFDERSGKKWLMVGLFELRPKQFLELYVEFGLWKRYVESLPKNRDED
jgi:uncharacterized protein (TIGR03663 family)